MNNKIIWGSVGLSFVGFLILNGLYGSLLYSKITAKEDMYKIGEVCAHNLDECEETYFQENLAKIYDLEKKELSYYADILIEEDHWGYSGNCPCPYDDDSRGGSCGERSSYSKNGEISYCYQTDIPFDLIAYKKETMHDDAVEQLEDEIKKNIDVYENKTILYLILILYTIIYFYLRKRFKDI